MEAATLDTLRAVNLLTSGILVGLITAEHFLILPLVRRLAPKDGVDALRFVAARAWVIGPGCGATAFVAGLVLLAFWPGDRGSAAALFTLVGVVLWTGAITLTFTWYLPTDREYRGLVPSSTRSEATAAMRRLRRANSYRYGCYFAGFASFAAALAM